MNSLNAMILFLIISQGNSQMPDAFTDLKWFNISNFILSNLIMVQYLMSEYSIDYFTLTSNLRVLEFLKGKPAFIPWISCFTMCVCVCVCVLVSCSVMSDSLWHMNCSLPGSSAHGILQARILEWVAIPFSRGSSWPRDWSWVPYIAGRFFTWPEPTREALFYVYHNW